MKWQPDYLPGKIGMDETLLNTSESFSERFLLLIQAVSSIRAFTSQDIEGLTEIEMLDQLLFSLIQNLDLERCSIFLLEGDKLNCATGKDWDEYIHKVMKNPNRRSHSFHLGQGVMGIAAEKGTVYHCKNCRLDTNYLPVINSEKELNVGSLISAPIMVGKECLGVLNVSHPEPNFFHLWQEHILAIHANILGQSLKNHRLLNIMQDEVDKRTEQLQIALLESETLKDQFENLSYVDDLTLLYNRRFLFTSGPQLLELSLEHNQPFSLLLLDIDNFKSINDTYSHDFGDKVLYKISMLLKEISRHGDIVSRIGGEEFAFVLPNTDMESAKELAEAIRYKIESIEWQNNDISFVVTTSIGISILSDRKVDSSKAPRLLRSPGLC